MTKINDLHTRAMDKADEALRNRARGLENVAIALFREALSLEREAAEAAVLEPTRSILFRSAATLAIDCNELRTAEKLIGLGLAGESRKDR